MKCNSNVMSLDVIGRITPTLRDVYVLILEPVNTYMMKAN